MTQEQAFAVLKSGRNVFLTGPAGSGKTYVLNRYISYLKGNKIPVAITASTGIAATHIGGTTIHSWCGMGIHDLLPDKGLRRLAQSHKLASRVRKAKVLIIDEVSMLDARRLALADRICRFVRNTTAPFGGIQVVLCGDFHQLPPIELASRFAFEGEVWDSLNLVICYLVEQHRQEDKDFLAVLNSIRTGIMDSNLNKILGQRINAEIQHSFPVRLFPHNNRVEEWNLRELGRLSDAMHVYAMTSYGQEDLIAKLKESCLAPEKLSLKKGAAVMFVKNNFETGFVNGTLGVVEGFSGNGYPIVGIKGKKSIIANPESWELEDENGDKVLAGVKQVPLQLAWAITIHKSQGMSLDAAEIDLSRAFAPGMGYVALSRVRSLNGLRLLGLNSMALQVHERVISFDKELQELSKSAELNDRLTPEKNGKGSDGGTYSVKEIRKGLPNAYKKWDKEEDEKLTSAYLKNFEVKELAKDFGRGLGAIRSRLRKLGLIKES